MSRYFSRIQLTASALLLGMYLLTGGIRALPAYAEEPQIPHIEAKSAAVLDVTDSAWRVLYHAQDKLYPASLTKLLTAILLVEHTKPTDVLTASQAAANQEPSNISLRVGEKLTAEDALYAMMLHSANDVAYMVAENVGGSIKNFAQMMNDKALALAMKNSHFVTPNGLHDPEHYSTAQDLAILMQNALSHPEIATAMKTKSYTLHRNFAPKVLQNQNEMLKDPTILGGKSGFTDQAGSCLIEVQLEKGHEVIAVNLKDPTRDAMYSDNQSLLDYTYRQFQLYSISKGDVLENYTPFLTGVNYMIHPLQDYTSTTYVRKEDLTTALKTDYQSWIPITGKPIGELQIIDQGKLLASVPVTVSLVSGQLQVSSAITVTAVVFSLLLLLRIYFYLLQYSKRSKQRVQAKVSRIPVRSKPQEESVSVSRGSS